MKKTAMFTMGTRGDVQPYIYLARELQKQGFDVILGSHPCWRSLIEEAGVSFEPVGPDIDIEKEAAVIRGKTSNPLLSILKTVNFIMRIIQGATNEVYKLCEGRDLIIVTHSQIGAVEAGVLGITTVNVTLQQEMIPQKLKTPTWKDKLIGGMIARMAAKPYNKIRKVYGLKPVKSADEIMSDRLNLIPISRYVLERNPYWGEENVITGYWYEEEPEYQPKEDLARFLEQGDRPVILALGAMSFEDHSEKEKLDLFVHAFEKTGCRTVIQGFQKTRKEYELPDTMIFCDSVPHSWLFRQGKCVIHHCGFGTTAASLVYGIPSIPVPHVLDQVGFAMQLEKAGVSSKLLRSKDLSEDNIINRIEEINSTYEEKRNRARMMSEKIRTEGGVSEAVRLIKEVDF